MVVSFAKGVTRLHLGEFVAAHFPENGRTIYRGYLSGGDVLLSESSMRDHALTPMRDANRVRVLGRLRRERKRCGGPADFARPQRLSLP